ncbi:hypothetical protein ACFPZI_14065, partial [Streptomyces chlorus]
MPGTGAGAALLLPTGSVEPVDSGISVGRAEPERWTAGAVGVAGGTDGPGGLGRVAASRWMGGPTGVAADAGAEAVRFGFATGTEVKPSGGSAARPAPSADAPGPGRRWMAGGAAGGVGVWGRGRLPG